MSEVNCLSRIMLLLAVCMSAGCGHASDSALRRECQPWVKGFFQKPSKAQITELRSFALDNQYKIYLCGNQIIHPPTMHLAEPFAQGGAAVAELLTAELSKPNSDANVRDIIMALREMQRLGTYEVARDRALMQLATDSVERMRDKDWQQMANEMLLEIEQGR